MGLSKSSSGKPTPRSMARFGARPGPPVVVRLFRGLGSAIVQSSAGLLDLRSCSSADYPRRAAIWPRCAAEIIRILRRWREADSHGRKNRSCRFALGWTGELGTWCLAPTPLRPERPPRPRQVAADPHQPASEHRDAQLDQEAGVVPEEGRRPDRGRVRRHAGPDHRGLHRRHHDPRLERQQTFSFVGSSIKPSAIDDPTR